MKINKLIKDINNYYLKKLMKKEQVFYQIEDDYILLSDKYIIAILKKDEFYLNINLMKQNDLLVKFIKELNDEVEIIEEDKKIEKLSILTFSDLIDMPKEELVDIIKEQRFKINEIINVINKGDK